MICYKFILFRLRKPLRFKLNEKIVCTSSSKWVEAVVIDRLCLNKESNLRDIAYKCQEVISGNIVVISQDSDDFIMHELFAKDSNDRMTHAIILNMSEKRIQEYTSSFPHFNTKELKNELIRTCLQHNNVEALRWLSRNTKVDIFAPLNSQGCSLAHLAIMNDQIDFLMKLEHLLSPEEFTTLLSVTDEVEMNSFHYVVRFDHIPFFIQWKLKSLSEKRMKLRNKIDKSGNSPLDLMNPDQFEFMWSNYYSNYRKIKFFVKITTQKMKLIIEEKKFKQIWRNLIISEEQVVKMYSFEQLKDDLEYLGTKEEEVELLELIREVQLEVNSKEFVHNDNEADNESTNDTLTTSDDTTSISSRFKEVLPVEIKEEKIYSIEISKAVEKWRHNVDSSVKDIFYRCVDRLASGRESYSTAKRLQGVPLPIFEMKLTKGCRIIYTRLKRGSESPSILVM